VDASVYERTMSTIYDECALEQAVLLKEAGAATEVVVFMVDTDNKGSQELLRKALAVGADRAVLVNVDSSSTDTLGLAKVLAATAKKEEVGLLLCGKQSSDGESGQVPSMLGELMDWTTVNVVSQLTIEGDSFTAHSDIGSNQNAVLKGPMPAVMSCDKALNKPRSPKFKERQAAKKKPLDVLNLGDLGLSDDDIATKIIETNWSLPPERTECKFIFVEDINSAVTELLGLLKNEAKVL